MILSISVNSDVLAATRWRIDRRVRRDGKASATYMDFLQPVSAIALTAYIEENRARIESLARYRYFDCTPADKPRFWVYTFKPWLVPKVRSGEKLRTIRRHRKDKKRPAVGDTVSLREWTGKPYASKQAVLRGGIVTRVDNVEVSEQHLHDGRDWLTAKQQNEFARLDGFRDAAEMRNFFRSEHGLPFTGVLVEWE